MVPHLHEVDNQLIEIAKVRGAKIMTNDFNLNKVAKVHNLEVLNINDLCQALRPVVLPGEKLRVCLLMEGKEHGQGIAHLDDGTMVVDHAKRSIGKTVEVVVTSVIQTSAGRMIFSSIRSRTPQISFEVAAS